ncbi:MAG: hypothetical protein IH897_05735 [Planctomycetes bacterium]|nr:hypothetical protein [Planctomycetota bacterium]
MELPIHQSVETDRSTGRVDSAAEWRAPLAIITMAGLAYLTLTGLLIYFAAFSVFNQYGVLIHTAFGVLWIPVFVWYIARHWWLRYRGKFNHIQLLGYVSFLLIATCILSGVVLGVQAAFGTRISYNWDLVHIVTGLVLAGVTVVHLAVVWVRRVNAPVTLIPLRAAKRRFLIWGTVGIALPFLVHAGLVAMHDEPTLNNDFPADYSWKFGKDRPFAPSLVRTVSDWAYDSRTLSGSAGCGTSGCHSEIYEEWQPSAHRYSSSDVAFQAVQLLMLQDVGAEATRYCAGCHDPIALLSGSKNVNVEGLTSPGADEGISCIVCHSIVETDVRGNADYEVDQVARYIGEMSPGPFNKWVSDFLIRAYPRQHKKSFSRDLYKTAEFCGACHKQFIDEEVNQIGWVQLQNQYDNWRKSRWYHEGDPTKTVTCRECHMPLQDSTDPAAGDTQDYNRSADDGKHRSHRNLAANQVIPILMDLPGAEKHVELTEAWLRGEIEVPEIADKWTSGPVIRLELHGPEQVKPGEKIDLQVVLTNNKTGHSFPTGPLDIIRSWVVLTAIDEGGKVVYQSGHIDEEGMIPAGTLVFKAEAIDRYGNDIDRHNLWEMVGARFKRSMFPGMSDTTTYSFSCPGLVSPAVKQTDSESQDHTLTAPLENGTLTVSAVLNYQKADAAFLDKLFGKEAGIRSRITQISEDSLTIQVVP